MSDVRLRNLFLSFSSMGLILLILFPQCVENVIKCDQRLMNEFGLAGMEYSIQDTMSVCRHITDKCCTISDEIRIYQYWNKYTKPILHRHVSDYMRYTSGIVRMFWEVMEINPQLIMLKHIVKKEVVYEYEVCSSEQAIESPSEANKFLEYQDFLLEQQHMHSFYANKSNEGKPFNTTRYSHDKWGRRHWEVNPNDEHRYYLDRRMNYTEVPIEEPPITYSKISCKKTTHPYEKEFVVVNEKKTEYCLDLYKSFLYLDNRHFKRFLLPIKNYLTQVVNIKGAVYCSICDAHSHRYFDKYNREIVLSQNFCKALIKGKRDLFHFMHIVFIEYIDALLQYIACFETDAEIYTFPFPTIITKYRRRFNLIKGCLDNIERDDFIGKCWFLCNKFSMFGISWFFDSEVKVVRRAYIALFSFLRKLKISERTYERQEALKKRRVFSFRNQNLDLTTKENVNGLLIEPLNPGHSISDKYYLDDDTRKKILGKLNTLQRPPENIKKAKEADKLLKNLGMSGLNQLSELKTDIEKDERKKKQLEKYLARFKRAETTDDYNKAKKELLRLEKEKEKRKRKQLRKKEGLEQGEFDQSDEKEDEKEDEKGKPLNTHVVGHSMVNGLVDHLYKIIPKHRMHRGYNAKRYLRDNNYLYEDVSKALAEFGLPEDVVSTEIQRAKLRARYSKLESERQPRELRRRPRSRDKKSKKSKKTKKTKKSKKKKTDKSAEDEDKNEQDEDKSAEDEDKNDQDEDKNDEDKDNKDEDRDKSGEETQKIDDKKNELETIKKKNRLKKEQTEQDEDKKREIERLKTELNSLKQKEKEESYKKKQYLATDEKKFVKPSPDIAKGFDVESASPFFEKIEKGYNVISYGMRFEPAGINMLQDYEMINYKFNITELLEQKFKPEEKLSKEVIYNYLKISPKKINRFNFDIKSFILGFRDVKNPIHSLLVKKLKTAQSRGKFKEVAKYRKKLKKIERSVAKGIKEKKNRHAKKKLVKKMKLQKAVKKHHKRVKAHHHIDKKHYDGNFNSIAEFFASMFGS